MSHSSSDSQLAAWANRHLWIYGCDLDTEWRQASDEGRNLASVRREFERLRGIEPDAGYFEHMMSGKRDARWLRDALALIDRVQTLPLDRRQTAAEPDGLEEIRAARGRRPALPRWHGTRREFAGQVRGGFLGRIAGCMLGKPFECADRAAIRIYAEETGNWPLQAYQRSPSPAERRRVTRRKPRRPLKPWQEAFYIDRLDGFPGDDDINYTILGMEVMRQHGANFTPLDMASLWIRQLPLEGTCSAEKAAYRNVAGGWLPPQSATRRNPFREWIGAQIRADFFGYAAPGNPARAAEWAWRDASISHVRNGIYGEMWVAAMLASAFVLDDWPSIVRAGLAEVPAKSRFRRGIEDILSRHAAGATHEEIVDGIHKEWDEFIPHHAVHTISNAQIVAASLLPGGGLAEVAGRAIAAGFDTDCNGATCGSLWGVRHGEAALPRRWVTPFRDRLASALAAYPVGSLDAMADRMVAVASSISKSEPIRSARPA